MGNLFKSMSGAYAYVLIFQILVVTGLFLFLLWLLVRRIQETAGAETMTVTTADSHAANAAPPAPSDPELQAKVQALELELSRSAGMRQENQALGEKVSYLESKLLEYEILQEEIGTLSSLKIENEQLKTQLMQGQPRTAPPAPVTAPVAAPIVEAPVAPIVAPIDEEKGPTQMAATADVISESDPEPSFALPPEAVGVVPPEIAPEAKPEKTGVAGAPSDVIPESAPLVDPPVIDEMDGLSHLLAQIDQLTKPTDKTS